MSERGAGPRIPPVGDPSEDVRALLESTGFSRDGKPLHIFATLAHHPRLLKRLNALGGVFMAHGSLPARAREIAILRVAARTECEYELAQHKPLGRRAGLTEAEIAALVEAPPGSGWSEDERALISCVDELLDRDDVASATWGGLSRHWSAEQLLELVLMVGFYRMLAGLLRAVRVELEPGLPSP